jgi:hypothetical protein
MTYSHFIPMSVEEWQRKILERWPEAVFIDNAERYDGADHLVITNAVVLGDTGNLKSYLGGYAFEDVSERFLAGTAWILSKDDPFAP